MSAMELMIPLIITGVVLYGVFKGVDVFSAMTLGARKGLSVLSGIFPALIALLPCVYMLRASGFADALAAFLSPLLSAVGVPAETVSLMLLRPISGSAALAVGSDVMRSAGTDSYAGRCAAVMLGSTETTFYVLAVYFGAAGIRKSRHAIPSALLADAAGFLAAAFFVRLFFGYM